MKTLNVYVSPREQNQLNVKIRIVYIIYSSWDCYVNMPNNVFIKLKISFKSIKHFITTQVEILRFHWLRDPWIIFRIFLTRKLMHMHFKYSWRSSLWVLQKCEALIFNKRAKVAGKPALTELAIRYMEVVLTSNIHRDTGTHSSNSGEAYLKYI